MADYTVDDTMATIIYEWSDREIHNDIRAELGQMTTEEIVDADASYNWHTWVKYHGLPAPGYTTFRYFTATLTEALSWKVYDHTAYDYDLQPYYDYAIKLTDTNDDETKAVELKNTGSKYGTIKYWVAYKYLASEQVTHEEATFNTLKVRATDDDSIRKYGRRVLNLQWPQGTSQQAMQGIVNQALERYKEPIPILKVTLIGDTDAKATQIFTREISDTIAVVCDKLGLASTTFYIDSINIKDDQKEIPVCTWGLIQQRTEEATGYFTIDTDSIDGAKLIA